MSSGSVLSSSNGALVWTDKVCDRLPGLSTIANIVNLVEKCLLYCFSSSGSIHGRYFTHINDKPVWRCFVLLVPVLGNLIVAIYDCNCVSTPPNTTPEQSIPPNRAPEQPLQREDFEDFQPEDFEDFKAQAVNSFHQEVVALTKAQVLGSYNQEIVALTQAISYYRPFFEDSKGLYTAPLLEAEWQQAKVLIANANRAILSGMLRYPHHEDDVVSKKNEILGLISTLFELRAKSYAVFLSTLNPDAILKEAKMRYVTSFEYFQPDESKFIEQKSPEEVLSCLKQRLRQLFSHQEVEIVAIIKVMSPPSESSSEK